MPSYDQSPNFGTLACPDNFCTKEERSLSPTRNVLKLQKSPLFDVQLESRSKKETRESLFMYTLWYEKILFPKCSSSDADEINFIKDDKSLFK